MVFRPRSSSSPFGVIPPPPRRSTGAFIQFVFVRLRKSVGPVVGRGRPSVRSHDRSPQTRTRRSGSTLDKEIMITKVEATPKALPLPNRVCESPSMGLITPVQNRVSPPSSSTPPPPAKGRTSHSRSKSKGGRTTTTHNNNNSANRLRDSRNQTEVGLLLVAAARSAAARC